MKTQYQYAVAVIGSGSGGREATLSAARKGLQTALIERDCIGGTSYHRGCFAILALKACARQFSENLASGRYGNEVDLSKATLYDWMVAQAKVSSRLANRFEADLQGLNVHLYQGYGELLDDHTVQVIGNKGAKTTLSADNVILATGSRPDFYASAKPRVVNSDELLIERYQSAR